MAQSRKNSKSLIAVEGIKRSSKESTPDFNNGPQISAPKYGTVIPDRVFVGGISSNTLPSELTEFFSKYGKVIDAKIISDRAGVSKGYGFVTFASNEEVHQLLEDVRTRDIMLRERKLNIAPAIKKQISGGNKMYSSFSQRLDANSNGASSVASSPLFPGAGIAYGPTFHNGMAYYSTPQAAQPQPPPAPPHHMDPSLYAGYPVPTAPTQYPPLFQQPVYFQQPQFAPQYPISYDGGDGSGIMDSTQLLMGGYYLPEAVTGQPLFAAPAPPEYAQQFLPQPQYPQYTPAPPHEQPMLPVSPRRYYDQLLVSEQVRGDKEEERKNAMAVVPVSPLMPKPMNNNNVEQTNRNLQPHPNPISSSYQVQPYPVFQARGPTPYQPPSPVPHHGTNSIGGANQNYRRPKPNYYQSWRGNGGASWKSRFPPQSKSFDSRAHCEAAAYPELLSLNHHLNHLPDVGLVIVNPSLSMQGAGGGGSGGSVGSGGGGIRRNGKRYSGTAGSVSSYGSGGGGPSPLSTPRSSDPTPSSAPSTPPSNQQQSAATQPAAAAAPQEALVQQMQALTA